MRLAEGLKVRKVAGQTLVVPIGKAVKTIKETAVLNDDAAYFVSLMQGEFTVDDIVNQCLAHYCDVTEERLRTDVEKIVNAMKKAGMILEDGEQIETETTIKSGETHTISGTVYF